MTAQPDSIRFYHPHEADDRPRTLFSGYDDYTTPDGPYTVTDEAMHVVLRHVQEFVAADTEDPFVRYCCLVADLGYRFPEEAFYELVDDYREEMSPEYADYWNGVLRFHLAPYTEAVAHRVLQHGDPEPDRDTRWRDSRGDQWWWASGWTSGACHYYWSQLEASDFPMTEERP